jgi:Na+:H+ antiporter, NhaA family
MPTARSSPDARAPRLLHPLRDFLRAEASGGVVLVAAAAAALAWANVAPSSYEHLWSTVFTIGTVDHHLALTLREWVNDGLMALFFFVVGLEIKRELVEGELRDRRRAALPVIAAIGGMALPALIYVAFNSGRAGANGWGIPMATDIAIAVGVLSLLGSRVPSSLKLFVLALAIVDDIGAIVVIAVFYSGNLDARAAVGVAACLGAMLVLRFLGVRAIWPYAVLGVGVWLSVYEGGVHATIAGVALGLLAPTKPLRPPGMIDADQLADVSTVETARETVVQARESVSVVEWLEHLLHPWTSYVIVPVFALANAGVVLDADSVDRAVSSPVTHGVVVGLVVGKLVGISLFAWLAVRLGIARLPDRTRFTQIVAVAALGGIGFTVSLFVSELAFGTGSVLNDDAKIGVLVASVTAAVLGVLLLLATTRASVPDDTGPEDTGPDAIEGPAGAGPSIS